MSERVPGTLHLPPARTAPPRSWPPENLPTSTSTATHRVPARLGPARLGSRPGNPCATNPPVRNGPCALGGEAGTGLAKSGRGSWVSGAQPGWGERAQGSPGTPWAPLRPSRGPVGAGKRVGDARSPTAPAWAFREPGISGFRPPARPPARLPDFGALPAGNDPGRGGETEEKKRGGRERKPGKAPGTDRSPVRARAPGPASRLAGWLAGCLAAFLTWFQTGLSGLAWGCASGREPGPARRRPDVGAIGPTKG